MFRQVIKLTYHTFRLVFELVNLQDTTLYPVSFSNGLMVILTINLYMDKR